MAAIINRKKAKMWRNQRWRNRIGEMKWREMAAIMSSEEIINKLAGIWRRKHLWRRNGGSGENENDG